MEFVPVHPIHRSGEAKTVGSWFSAGIANIPLALKSMGSEGVSFIGAKTPNIGGDALVGNLLAIQPEEK